MIYWANSQMKCFQKLIQKPNVVTLKFLCRTIFFTKSRQGSRGEEDARQFDFSAPHWAKAPDRHRAVQRDALHLFADLRVADEHILQGIPTHLAHQAGVGVVRNGPQQRPNHTLVEPEGSVAVHSVAQDDRYAFPAHFDVVLMGCWVVDVPNDAAVRSDLPACFGDGSLLGR